jgi:hypothetical protein
MHSFGMNTNDPPAAHGTMLPSILPIAGGPPHTAYPCSESDAEIPHKSSE